LVVIRRGDARGRRVRLTEDVLLVLLLLCGLNPLKLAPVRRGTPDSVELVLPQE
jgi:hypothetical protein